MNSKTYLLAIFFIYNNCKEIKSSRAFDIRWTKANCTIMDSSWMSLFMCPIRELPKNRGNYLQVHFKPKQNINAIMMDFTVSTPTQNKHKNVDFLKFRTDACKLGSFQSKNPMVAAIFKNLIKGDNFPKNCPLEANFTYSMAHFALNPDYFPGYTPEMNVTTKINLFINKKQIIYVNIAARIMKRKSKL